MVRRAFKARPAHGKSKTSLLGPHLSQFEFKKIFLPAADKEPPPGPELMNMARPSGSPPPPGSTPKAGETAFEIRRIKSGATVIH